jgi:hypothetical protein
MGKCGNKALMLEFLDQCGRNLDPCIAQPLPLLEPLVEPVPNLEMGRAVSERASGIKFLPQHSSFEYQWIILNDVGQSGSA